MDGKVFKYKLPDVRLGIDDLKSEYAFVSADQGGGRYTNSVEEYKNSGGWLICIFPDINPYDQEAVNKEAARRADFNRKYIESLKKSGEYGKIVDGGYMYLKHCDKYDNPVNNNETLENYRLAILNFSEE